VSVLVRGVAPYTIRPPGTGGVAHLLPPKHAAWLWFDVPPRYRTAAGICNGSAQSQAVGAYPARVDKPVTSLRLDTTTELISCGWFC